MIGGLDHSRSLKSSRPTHTNSGSLLPLADFTLYSTPPYSDLSVRMKSLNGVTPINQNQRLTRKERRSTKSNKFWTADSNGLDFSTLLNGRDMGQKTTPGNLRRISIVQSDSSTNFIEGTQMHHREFLLLSIINSSTRRTANLAETSRLEGGVMSGYTQFPPSTTSYIDIINDI